MSNSPAKSVRRTRRRGIRFDRHFAHGWRDEGAAPLVGDEGCHFRGAAAFESEDAETVKGHVAIIVRDGGIAAARDSGQKIYKAKRLRIDKQRLFRQHRSRENRGDETLPGKFAI